MNGHMAVPSHGHMRGHPQRELTVYTYILIQKPRALSIWTYLYSLKQGLFLYRYRNGGVAWKGELNGTHTYIWAHFTVNLKEQVDQNQEQR